MADREKNNYKRKFYLPGIRQTIFSNFEVVFGVSETQLLENFTFEGRKVDKRFLQTRVKDAVNAFFQRKVEPEAYVIGEFEKISLEGQFEGQGLPFVITTCLASTESCLEEETPSNLTMDMDSFALEEDPHQALLGLFAKKSVVKTHDDGKNTGNLEFGSDIRKLTIKLLSHGIAATAIKVFYDSLYEMFEKSFNANTKSKPPAWSWINSQRDLIELLCNQQIEEEISTAQSLTLVHDGTTVNRDGAKLMTAGVINQDCKFIAIESRVVPDGTAETGANSVIGSLTREAIEKTDRILCDTAHTATKTSRLLAEKMQIVANDEKERGTLACGLHTRSNQNRNHDDANSPQFKQYFLDVQVLFSKRQGQGYRREDISQALRDLLELQQPLCANGFKRFKSSLGCRLGTSGHNSLVSLLHRNQILQLVKDEQKIKAESPQSQLNRLQRVESMLNDANWPLTASILGINVMFLYCLTNPLAKLESNQLSLTEKKLVIQEIYSKYDQIIKSHDCYEELRRIAIQVADVDFQDALTTVDNCWAELSLEDRGNLSDQVKTGSIKALAKVKKDQDRLLKLADSDELFVTTNRRAESVFATYKGLEKFFLAMSPHRLEFLSRARINKVS